MEKYNSEGFVNKLLNDYFILLNVGGFNQRNFDMQNFLFFLGFWLLVRMCRVEEMIKVLGIASHGWEQSKFRQLTASLMCNV